jgi:UDP-MurNAc hydroxylase
MVLPGVRPRPARPVATEHRLQFDSTARGATDATGGHVRVTYYGQACTLIEVEGRKILTDPWLTEGAFAGTWFHTHLLSDVGVSPRTARDADIDFLFLSHEHEDHFDPCTLREFRRDLPVLICRFPTPRFYHEVTKLGFTDVRQLTSGEPLDLGDGVKVTVFQSAEYTNDSAILVEGEGIRVFNETDCKLEYADLARIGQQGVDIGFYMFSGANWYPMMYDYPPGVMQQQIRRRRANLLKSLVQRIRVTRPRLAVPSAGPCSVLEPERLWLNSEEHGIFIDPELAVAHVRSAALPAEPLYLAASDAWDSRGGVERHAPDELRRSRRDYLEDAAARMGPTMQAWRAAEPPAGADLPERLVEYFEARVGAQTPDIRRRINAKLGLVVTGTREGTWTVDFTAPGPRFVREGLDPEWTYRVEVEDRLIYPYLNGQMEFLEDMFLTLRVAVARRPDEFNEPLYNFLYDPDPERMRNWYAAH